MGKKVNMDHVIEARYQALTNAAEFIRSHGEEGGIGDDFFGYPVEIYLKEAKKIADRLGKQAERLRKKHNF